MWTHRSEELTERREWGQVDALLIWLSGASPRILRQCPTERPKYTGIGSVILVTSLVATISMGFLLHQDVGAALGWAILLSLVWGLAIASLDRWLTVSLDRQPAPLRYLFLALPRILLGILIGVVITVPLMMQIFRSEIDAQISVDQQVQINSYIASLPNTTLSKEVAADQQKVTYLENVIDASGVEPLDLSKDPTVMNLTLQVSQATAAAATAYDTWQADLYGTQGGVAAGNGPLAEAAHSEYLTWTAKITNLNQEIQAREKTLTAQAATASVARLSQAKQELPAARAQLEVAENEFNHITENAQQSINNDTGLQAHLQAISQDISHSQVLYFAAATVFLLFLLIQLLPIVVKVLLNLGPQNTYEKMVFYEEEAWLRAAREDIARRQTKRNLE
jgi:hypothetical protein